jgi:hypothetical protein
MARPVAFRLASWEFIRSILWLIKASHDGAEAPAASMGGSDRSVMTLREEEAIAGESDVYCGTQNIQ